MSNFEFDLSSITPETLLAPTIAKIKNPRPLYRSWANYLESVAVDAFKQERSPDGTPWAPLSAAYLKYKQGYAKRKRRGGRDRGNPKGGGRLKLRFTGGLYNSLYSRATNDGAEMGTNQKVGSYDLGAIHQFGARVPARPFLPIDQAGNLFPNTYKELNELLADYLNE